MGIKQKFKEANDKRQKAVNEHAHGKTQVFGVLPEDLSKKDFPVPDTFSKQNSDASLAGAQFGINGTRIALSEEGDHDYTPLYLKQDQQQI